MHILLPFFHLSFTLCSCGYDVEPAVHIFEKAVSSRLPGSAVDYFYCNSERKENKKCVYVYIYISTGLFTHTLKINIHWSFKPSAKLEKLVFALESFLAPKAKDSIILCRAAASLQPLHLYFSGAERRVAKSLLHLSAFLPLVLLPSLCFQPPQLTSHLYIYSALCNKNATISQLEPFCCCPTLIGTSSAPECCCKTLSLPVPSPDAIQKFLHFKFVFLSRKHLLSSSPLGGLRHLSFVLIPIVAWCIAIH